MTHHDDYWWLAFGEFEEDSNPGPFDPWDLAMMIHPAYSHDPHHDPCVVVREVDPYAVP